MRRRVLTRRRLVAVLTLAAGLVLLARPWASASLDLFGNVGPGSSGGSLMDRYALENYTLDHHFDPVTFSLSSGLHVDGVPALIAYFLADVLWMLTAFLVKTTITIFGFAFSLDLLHGSPQTGGAGALAPVSDAIHGLYAHTFGEPWMVAAIFVAGCWAMWRGLVQRRYTQTVAQLGMSLVYCLLALVIVSHPAQTIGYVSTWTNQASAAFLSITTHGDVTTADQARRDATDQLFDLTVYRPWLALEFGGVEHCVRNGTGSADHDPISVPVRPLARDPRLAARLSGQLATGHRVTADGKTCIPASLYAPDFLAYDPDTPERAASYDAFNHGGLANVSDPFTKLDFRGPYQPTVADKPATDAMEQGGQFQRLLLAIVLAIGDVGAVLLVGSLSLAVVLAQVLVLLMACFSPVALVAATVPGRGHDYFRGWLSKTGTYLIRKAAYSLVLAVVLAVVAALQDATAGLGWLMSFALQALLIWAVYLQRRALVGQLSALVTGARDTLREDRLGTVLAGGAYLWRRRRRRRPRPPHVVIQQPPPVGPPEPPPAGPQQATPPAPPPPPSRPSGGAPKAPQGPDLPPPDGEPQTAPTLGGWLAGHRLAAAPTHATGHAESRLDRDGTHGTTGAQGRRYGRERVGDHRYARPRVQELTPEQRSAGRATGAPPPAADRANSRAHEGSPPLPRVDAAPGNPILDAVARDERRLRGDRPPRAARRRRRGNSPS